MTSNSSYINKEEETASLGVPSTRSVLSGQVFTATLNEVGKRSGNPTVIKGPPLALGLFFEPLVPDTEFL